MSEIIRPGDSGNSNEGSDVGREQLRTKQQNSQNWCKETMVAWADFGAEKPFHVLEIKEPRGWRQAGELQPAFFNERITIREFYRRLRNSKLKGSMQKWLKRFGPYLRGGAKDYE